MEKIRRVEQQFQGKIIAGLEDTRWLGEAKTIMLCIARNVQ